MRSEPKVGMKKNKQKSRPELNEILFIDSATGDKFVCVTTLTPPSEKREFNGKEYPAVTTPVSCFSHPAWTGSGEILATNSRVQNFKKRYGQSQAHTPSKPPSELEKAKDKARARQKKK